jgi:flavin reductase (DIM6/NTAB) family NADH-FMN oxidoreductase RutF
MPISPDTFRDALSQYASGVTIITVKSGDETHGLTASAFASVSAEPPLIAIFVNHKGRAHTLFERSDAVFAVNFLRDYHENLSNHFAFSKEDKFSEGDWTTAHTGAPILTDALAWLDCTVYSRVSMGSHSIYVGEIQAAEVLSQDENPLLYWNRGYRLLDLPTSEEKVAE